MTLVAALDGRCCVVRAGVSVITLVAALDGGWCAVRTDVHLHTNTWV